MDRRSEAVGGWGALAVGALTLAGAVAEVAVILTLKRHDLAGARGPTLALAAVTLLRGLSQLAAVQGLDVALRPPAPANWSRVTRLAAWVGGAGAATLVAEALLGAYGLLAHPSAIGPLMGGFGLAASALTAVWAVTTCAAAWKVERLPKWVRVAGAAFGVLAIVNIVLPMAQALTLLAALAWWLGLGAALLRGAREGPATKPSDTGKGSRP